MGGGGHGAQYHSWYQGIKGQGKTVEGTVLPGTKVNGRATQWGGGGGGDWVAWCTVPFLAPK